MIYVILLVSISAASSFASSICHSSNLVNCDVLTVQDFVYWPNGTIPFFINKEHFDEEQAQSILRVLAVFTFKTCLKFKPVHTYPEHDQHVMVFQNSAALRRCILPVKGHPRGTPEIIELGLDCLNSPLMEMIVMKWLGFPFEHNRWLRDVYVDVRLENVAPDSYDLFAMDAKLPPELRNVSYDINSVLHFGERDYSRNGHKTLVFKNPKTVQKRVTLTENDLRKIEIVYGPQCKIRDAMETIEMCQHYPQKPEKSRKKRQIDSDQNLRINPNIKPQPEVLTTLNTKLRELGIDVDVKNLVDQASKVLTKILDNKRQMYCNGSVSRQTSGDLLELSKLFASYGEGVTRNAEKDPNSFCKVSNSVTAYALSYNNDGISSLNAVGGIGTQVARKKRDADANNDVLNASSIVTASASPANEDVTKKTLDKSNLTNQPVVIEREVNTGLENVTSNSLKQPLRRLNVKNNLTVLDLPPETVDFYSQRIWQSKYVRYYIKDDDLDATNLRTRIAEVNRILKENTCVNLNEITKQDMDKYENYLVIDGNVSDYVTGMVGGEQIFGAAELFQDNLHRQYTAMMVMAMLGFYFEVSRHDRDKYIKVHTRHIRPDKLHHFEPLPPEATFDLPYDYMSATHPSWTFWRKSSMPGVASVATFKDVDPDGSIMKKLGKNEPLLSDSDIVKINSLYGINCLQTKRSRIRNRRKAKLNGNKI